MGVGLLFLASKLNEHPITDTKPSEVSDNGEIKTVEIDSTPMPIDFLKANQVQTNHSLAILREDSIWVNDINGQNPMKLISSDKTGTIFHTIDWSPDGSKLLFSATFGSDKESNGLFLYDSLAGTIYKIAKFSSGTWSPQGDRIVIFEKELESSGLIKIYEPGSNGISLVSPDITQSFSGPLHWDNNGNIYLKTWNPVTYCRNPTPNCEILEKTKENAVHKIVKINLKEGSVEDIVTRKLIEGGISDFTIIPQKEKLIFGENYKKVYEVDLISDEVTSREYDNSLNIFEITSSPNGERLFMNDRAGSRSLIVDSNLNETIEFEQDVYGIEDWYTDREVIARVGDNFYPTDEYVLINLNNLEKNALNISGHSLYGNSIKVRPK